MHIKMESIQSYEERILKLVKQNNRQKKKKIETLKKKFAYEE